MATAARRARVAVDVVSDTVCPWCFVGKRNLDKAIAEIADVADVEVRWHAYQLNPKASKEGVSKLDLYRSLFGDRMPAITARMTGVFEELGLKYNLGGLTGNTLDSHRLISLAGMKDREQGGLPASSSLQHRLVEELFLDYFTREKFIGDRQVLLSAAERAGLQGAAEWLDNPQAGLQEVEAELQRYRPRVSGVPHFIIGGQEFSGAQPPAVLLQALRSATSTDA
ncbi:hypothetical protein CLOM_g14305 [Closterium sp. NIES-68]|nr:hypothetical protein CLOM_g14305 [Closterium sp. NIES-68]GJP61713.1 hypothetical protein CLOP_g18855 [Closterium sp. NIES-67]